MDRNRVITLLLPSAGSYASESYGISMLQALIDVVGCVGLTEAFQTASTYDAGITGLAGLALLAGNRMISVGINRTNALDYNSRLALPIPSGPDPRAFHGGLELRTGRSTVIPGLGAFLEYRGAGLRLTADGLDEEDQSGSDPGVVPVSSSRQSQSLGLEGYCRLPAWSIYEVQPGMLASFSQRSFSESGPDPQNPATAKTVDYEQPATFSLFAFADIAIHPWTWLQFSLGLSARVYGPGAVERPHGSAQSPGKPPRYLGNLAVAWRIW